MNATSFYYIFCLISVIGLNNYSLDLSLHAAKQPKQIVYIMLKKLTKSCYFVLSFSCL